MSRQHFTWHKICLFKLTVIVYTHVTFLLWSILRALGSRPWPRRLKDVVCIFLEPLTFSLSHFLMLQFLIIERDLFRFFLPRYIPVLLLSCGTCTVTVLTLCACVCSLFCVCMCVYVCTHTGSHVCMHACLPFFARPQCLFIAEQMYIAADANVVVYPNVFAQLWQGR